jgi:lipoprotein-anchoring transpeptidase ErfK/SrfK
MRRLVGISSTTRKAGLVLLAFALFCTSIHMAAAARTASLRREQEKLESSALSVHQSAVNQPQPSDAAKHPEPSRLTAGAISGQSIPAPKPAYTVAVPKRQIVISIADRKLALLEDGQVLKIYPIAVGTRHTPSPDGDFVVINHAEDPVYRHGDKEIPPGKDNPLGTRWMGLSLKGYGIHGTNVQGSVGKAASHGCFRMRKQDVEELYRLVHVGDTVTVRRERDAMIARVFAAPASEPAVLLARSEATSETTVTAAAVTTVETNEQ